MARSRRRPDGIAILVAGSRGSGKSGWTIQETEVEPRLLVWDSVGEWSRAGLVRPAPTLEQLHALIVADLAQPTPMRAGYTGRISDVHFEAFCRLSMVWMKAAPGAVVIEELADVTSPGKAPPAWGELVRKGRHYGGSIYALTQRPAESDKTIAGNADIIHTGRLSFPRDRKTMAEYLDVPVQRITALPSLHYIERDMRTRALATGVLTFKSRRKA